MTKLNLKDFFAEFKSGRKFDQPTIVRVMEDMLRTLIKKKYGSDENFSVIVNPNGDIEMLRHRLIVADGEVADESLEISLTEARLIDPSYQIGEDCYEELPINDFGRRAIQAARQTLISRMSELQKDDIVKRFSDRLGELVGGEVTQVLRRDYYILDLETGYELLLPRTETMRQDNFRKGDNVKAVIKSVEVKNSNPVVILSRTDDRFLERLLEKEVPEIEDGIVTIKKVVRLPGERAKIAVESNDDRIEPVGACVGTKGSRIQSISRELHFENIDVIPFTNNPVLFIQRALTPAKGGEVKLDTEAKRAAVYLKQDQVALAIGKSGSNIKLAGKLTGYEIDVYRDSEEYEIDDVNLEEFGDVFEPWIIAELKRIGCETARDVLELTKSELLRRTELEEEMIDELIRVFSAEFED